MSYTKQTWANGDIITASKLNHMEDGIAGVEADVSSLDTQLLASMPHDTASGSIASFPDGAAMPVIDCSVAVAPNQDLHGYDNPWPAGGWKNLFPLPTMAETKNGVTVEATTNGEIWVHGAPTIASGYISFSLPQITSAIIGNTATISINEKVVGIGFDTNISGGGLSFSMSDTATAKTGVVNAINGTVIVNVRFDVGTVDKKFKIQLELGTAATAWTPFSNICPISGWTECKVYVSPTQNAQDATVYTIDLDGTRYGGTLDVLAGKLTMTDGYIASYNGETLPSTWISDRDVYAPGTTPTTGAEVVYKLASPFEIDLTETEVELLTGTNNIWSDTGDVTVTIGNEIPTPYPLGGAVFPSVSNGDVLVFDGIDGKITKNGANAAASVNWTEFPQLFPGENTITCPDDVTVEYYPTYI